MQIMVNVFSYFVLRCTSRVLRWMPCGEYYKASRTRVENWHIAHNTRSNFSVNWPTHALYFLQKSGRRLHLHLLASLDKNTGAEMDLNNTSTDNSSLQNLTTHQIVCPAVGYERTSKTIQTIAYCVVLLLSLVGNTLIILVVYRNPRMWTSSNYLIVNMAASDLLLPFFAVPRMIVEVLVGRERWLIGGTAGLFLPRRVHCGLCPKPSGHYSRKVLRGDVPFESNYDEIQDQIRYSVDVAHGSRSSYTSS